MSSKAFGINDLPQSLQVAVRHETTGEVVRWVAMSPPGKTFLYTTPIWLMAIPWTAFSLFWEYTAIASMFAMKSARGSGIPSAMAWAFALFGIPFVLIGLGMMLAPFWAARKARQTAYILTDRRFLTICAGHATTVKSIDPSRIVATEATRHADGSGHINMTLGFARDGDGGTETTSEKLWAVPAVARLEALLREFRRAQS